MLMQSAYLVFIPNLRLTCGEQGEAGEFQQQVAARERDVAMLEAGITQVRTCGHSWNL